MTSQERVLKGYVMVACVKSRKLKNGTKIFPKKGTCFPIWKKAKSSSSFEELNA